MIESYSQEVSNTTIQYLSSADVTTTHLPLLYLFHGFPENSWTWEAYIEALSDEYCVIAPDLPGYNLSQGFDTTEQYNIPNLVSIMAEFVTAICSRSSAVAASLVAHDWGGVIAWPLVAFHDSLFKCVTIVNAAHPTTFTREMLHNPKQQANSDYITDLISDTAYDIVSKDEYRMLKRLYGGHFDKLSARQKSGFVSQWADARSMEQSFAYYKNMPQLVTTRLSSDIKGETASQNLPNIYIKIPTQVLWGLKDTAFVPEVLDGMEEWVDKLSLITFDDADHWIHHQKQNALMSHIRQFHKQYV